VLPHPRICRKVGVADQRADTQAAFRGVFDLVERQTVDVDQGRWCLHLQLHEIEQVGAAGNELDAGFARRDSCIRDRLRAPVGEGFHVCSPIACLIAATMFG
jgi:hypothetical protein